MTDVLQGHLDQSLKLLINDAEKRFGERNHSRSILPVSFHAGCLQIFYPTPTQIQIKITNVCAADLVRANYQLAHEAVHFLSPVDKNEVTVLEEGLATLFAHLNCQKYSNSGNARYDAARAKVESFLAARPDAILALRKHEPVISRIDNELICKTYSDVSRADAIELTQKFITFMAN